MRLSLQYVETTFRREESSHKIYQSLKSYTTMNPAVPEMERALAIRTQNLDSSVNIDLNLLGLVPVSQGSGFFIAKDQEKGTCEVATDFHVIDHSLAWPTITTAGGESYSASIGIVDEKNDLAILKINGVKDAAKTCRVLELSEDVRPVNLGETLVSLAPRIPRPAVYEGYEQFKRFIRAPWDLVGVAQEYRASSPRADFSEGEQKDRELLHARIPSYKGDSGSAVLEIEHQRVVGVLSKGTPWSSLLTPAYLVRKAQEEMHRRDAQPRPTPSWQLAPLPY
jgi:hypothetical protein